MRPGGCEAEILRALSEMPFLDRLEMVELSGWSRGAVYGAVDKLESGGFCAPAPHAVDPLPPTRRFHLTAAGLQRLAEQEGVSPDELVRRYPVSAQWRRSLMERLDALAAIYRLACAVSRVAFPVRFRWYRSLPLDAGLTLPGGRTVGILRQGLTADRTGFAKRLWRLRQGPIPNTVLILMADEVRLRHARRLLSVAPVPALLAVESRAVLAGAGDRIWTPPAVNAVLDLRYVLERAAPGGELPVEDEPQRATLPDDFAVEGPGWDIPDHLLPVLLKAAEKRALDLVSDWPWLAVKELAGLLGRLSPQGIPTGQPPGGLRPGGPPPRGRGTAGPHRPGPGPAGPPRPHLPGRGEEAVEHRRRRRPGRLPLAQRLRQERPPVAPQHRAHRRRPCLPGCPDRPGPAAGLGGRPTGPAPQSVALLPLPGTDALHQRRRLRHIAEKAKKTWPFFLEWERRAVRPSTMSARLAPYLRYFSSRRPTDDQGIRPSVLVVFEDDIAQTHFLRLAREEMQAHGVNVPLWVSHREAIEQLGPLGQSWRSPNAWGVAPGPCRPNEQLPAQLPE